MSKYLSISSNASQARNIFEYSIVLSFVRVFVFVLASYTNTSIGTHPTTTFADFLRIDFANYKYGSTRSIGQSSSYANLNLTEDDHVKKLSNFAKGCLGVSCFFWCWAFKNSMQMTGNFDLGMISFFFSGSSSFFIHKITNDGVKGFRPVGRHGRLLIVSTHVIVALNYALGAYIACTLGETVYYGFLFYCMGFTLLWSISAFLLWDLISNTFYITPEVDEADFNF